MFYHKGSQFWWRWDLAGRPVVVIDRYFTVLVFILLICFGTHDNEKPRWWTFGWLQPSSAPLCVRYLSAYFLDLEGWTVMSRGFGVTVSKDKIKLSDKLGWTGKTKIREIKNVFLSVSAIDSKAVRGFTQTHPSGVFVSAWASACTCVRSLGENRKFNKMLCCAKFASKPVHKSSCSQCSQLSGVKQPHKTLHCHGLKWSFLDLSYSHYYY